MALLKNNSVIHASADADLTAFTYTQVYCGTAGTVTINGTDVSMAAGSTLDIRIKEISSVSGIYVIGSNINTLKADILL